MKHKLERLITEGPKELRRAMVEVAERKLPLLRAATPKKKGWLRESERVRVMVSTKKEDLRVSFIAGDERAWYARIVESRVQFMEKFILGQAGTVGGEIAAQVDLKRAAGA